MKDLTQGQIQDFLREGANEHLLIAETRGECRRGMCPLLCGTQKLSFKCYENCRKYTSPLKLKQEIKQEE